VKPPRVRRSCASFGKKPLAERTSKPIKRSRTSDRLITWRALSFDPFAVQAEVETFPLRFFGDAQSDRDVNDLEENVAADAADKQGSQHTVDLERQVGIDGADVLDLA